MHAPHAAQYWVMGGSGAGSGGIAAMSVWEAPAALAAVVGSEALCSAIAADAGRVAEAACPALAVGAAVPAAGVADAALLAAAVAGFSADAGLGAAGAAPPGMLAPIGAAEKVLGGSGGRDGAPVEDVLVPAGLRGGICGSCAMLIFVCLLAVA